MVKLTTLIRTTLESEGFDADAFAKDFATWKALGPPGEYSEYYFGKDGEYASPLRAGRRVLRHVHLPPESDEEALRRWRRHWELGRRKTSDASLIYTYDARHGYLLIFVAREPTGHEIASMATNASRNLMNQFADVAEAFIFDGSVII